MCNAYHRTINTHMTLYKHYYYRNRLNLMNITFFQWVVINMAMTIACKDLDTDCNYVARGENKEELMADAGKHAKEVHDYTDEQLKDPKMMKIIKAVIKTEQQVIRK